MKVKLYQNYSPIKPVEEKNVDNSINELWNKIESYYDFEKKGFLYNSDDINSNKHLEENTIVTYLLLNKIENWNGILNKKNLIETVDLLLDKWDAKRGVSSVFTYDWKSKQEDANTVKILDFALATLKVCEITSKKKYIFSLIEILNFLVKEYKIDGKSRIFFNNRNGIVSWGVIKYTLLLSELYSFVTNNKTMYEPQMSIILFNIKSDSFVDFKNQLKSASVKYIEELHKFLGKPGYGFIRNANKNGEAEKNTIKLYGNSILGINIIKMLTINENNRDLTRDIDGYLKDILLLTNELWDEEFGGYYREIDFTNTEKGIVKEGKNIISNILANRFLLEYIFERLANLDIDGTDKVDTELMQLLHQLDVGVKKLIEFNTFGILNTDNEWKNKVMAGEKLAPIYLLLDLLIEYKKLNDHNLQELNEIRNKIKLYISNKIFLSHNSKDKELIRVLNNKIIENGYSTYFDENEHPDLTNEIKNNLEKGIINSGLIIFFVTENFDENSEFLNFEIEAAIKEKEKRGNYFQIQIVLDENSTVPKKLEKYWRKRDAIIFKKGEDYKLDIFSYINKNIPSYIRIKNNETV